MYKFKAVDKHGNKWHLLARSFMDMCAQCSTFNLTLVSYLEVK